MSHPLGRRYGRQCLIIGSTAGASSFAFKENKSLINLGKFRAPVGIPEYYYRQVMALSVSLEQQEILRLFLRLVLWGFRVIPTLRSL